MWHHTARINHLTTTQQNAALLAVLRDDPELETRAREHAAQVDEMCHQVWSPEEFLQHNRLHWITMHRDLAVTHDGAASKRLPYTMDEVMGVVREERPTLFSQDDFSATGDTLASTAVSDDALAMELRQLPEVERQAHMEATIVRLARELAGNAEDIGKALYGQLRGFSCQTHVSLFSLTLVCR